MCKSAPLNIHNCCQEPLLQGFPGGAVVKNSPANSGGARGMGSILGWEDPLDKGMANHSSILAWKIPWTEEPGGLQFMGSQKSQTWLSMHAYIHIPLVQSFTRIIEIVYSEVKLMDFPGGSDGKASVYHSGDPGSILGSERSPGEGNGSPLQYSCLENPMNRGVHGVAEGQTWLNDFTFTLNSHANIC